MIRIARQKVADQRIKNVAFEVADADNPAPDSPMDAVMAFNLLHLADDPAAVIANVRAMLPEGGLFISKTPCLGGKWWFRPLLFALNLFGKASGKVQSFHSHDLHRLMEQNGFEMLETGAYPKKMLSYYIVAKAV